MNIDNSEIHFSAHPQTVTIIWIEKFITWMQGNELNTTLLRYIFFDFLILCVTCKRIINMYVL